MLRELCDENALHRASDGSATLLLRRAPQSTASQGVPASAFRMAARADGTAEPIATTNSSDPAIQRSSEDAPHHLAPTEVLLNALADGLADRTARMACRSTSMVLDYTDLCPFGQVRFIQHMEEIQNRGLIRNQLA